VRERFVTFMAAGFEALHARRKAAPRKRAKPKAG
jgi:hypothetical protein